MIEVFPNPGYDEKFAHELYVGIDPTHDGYLFARLGSHMSPPNTGPRLVHNVRHHCVHHSPDGFEWGYGGSGPSDLALNIIEDVFIRTRWRGPMVDVYRGQCRRLSYQLHIGFKSEFVATLPSHGGVIPWEAVTDWIRQEARELL